jgi:hypothetical protein
MGQELTTDLPSPAVVRNYGGASFGCFGAASSDDREQTRMDTDGNRHGVKPRKIRTTNFPGLPPGATKDSSRRLLRRSGHYCSNSTR